MGRRNCVKVKQQPVEDRMRLVAYVGSTRKQRQKGFAAQTFCKCNGAARQHMVGIREACVGNPIAGIDERRAEVLFGCVESLKRRSLHKIPCQASFEKGWCRSKRAAWPAVPVRKFSQRFRPAFR